MFDILRVAIRKKKKKRKINSILSRSIRLLVNIVIAIWKTCVRRTYVRKTRKKYKIVLAKFTNQVDEPRKKEKNTTEGPPSFNSYLRSMHDNEFLPFFFFFFFFSNNSFSITLHSSQYRTIVHPRRRGSRILVPIFPFAITIDHTEQIYMYI